MTTWTDSRCGKTWGGLRAEHCPACHNTFSGTTAGDKHRTRDFHCLTPEDVGLVYNPKRHVWHLPMSDRDRERLTTVRQNSTGQPSGPVRTQKDTP